VTGLRVNSKVILGKGILATTGWLLSPLSWWNDLYINFPIAYGMAWAVSLIDRRLFAAALLSSYWLTNIAGLIMLHKGVTPSHAGAENRRKNFRNDLIISLVYTAVIAVMLHLGLLRLPQEYFR